jgi:hypothetical protein
MAFLPTVALFLAVAVADEAPVEVVEEEAGEEEAALEEGMEEEMGGASFAECAANTTWAEEDAAQGYTLDASTTCNDVHPMDCLKHADIATCCPDECNKELICGGFESATGPELALCLNAVRWRGGSKWFAGLNPSYWGLSDWGNDVNCPTLLADPKATSDHSEINLCCNASAAAARRLADDADEAEAETTDDAADQPVAMGGGMYPVSTGEELVSMMCNGASAPPTPSDEETETNSGESDGTDTAKPDSSASTFGFTALALMLVTA